MNFKLIFNILSLFLYGFLIFYCWYSCHNKYDVVTKTGHKLSDTEINDILKRYVDSENQENFTFNGTLIDY